MLDLIQATPALSLFLPVDSAWDLLPDIEKKYLESEFAEDDLTSIANMHAVWQSGDEVMWVDNLKNGDKRKWSKPVHHGYILTI